MGRTGESNIAKLQNKIIQCKKCPRLVKYLGEIKKKYDVEAGLPSLYWCKPVPSFGDVNAEILIVGLAPGRFGSNRTGRMFTGDSSGEFLYQTLHDVGLCDNPLRKGLPWQAPTHAHDGLVLKNCYITAMARCAPPQNKPTPKELENCFPYFVEELRLFKNIKTVVCLGKIAFDGYLKWLFLHRNDVLRKNKFKFSHGAIYRSKNLPHVLIASYHPSRQNTQTGRLTYKMFKQVFEKAIECSAGEVARHHIQL